jgi:ABC-type transporter Mla subunit MlaD
VTRRRTQHPFTSPVLIGAVTVLVAVIAMFLAYNANTGLPFVPTRVLRVDVANGVELVPGNLVNDGGADIGIVSAERPVRVAGRVVAQLTLQLHANQRIPVDSRATILSRSVLGLKYVSLSRGRSARIIPNGGVLSLSHTSVPVQLYQVFGMFTPRVRSAVQAALLGGGDVLASRGVDLNQTIEDLPPLFGYLTPVARYLAAPGTRLVRFIDRLNGFMGTVAPVAGANARLLADAATTFEAISHSRVDLQQTIAKSPPTLSVSTASLRVQQPFLVDLTRFADYLRPASAQLRAALPVIDPAIEQGTRVLGRTPPLDARLQRVMVALRRLALAPATDLALSGLASTVDTLDPMIRYLGPYVTVCNDWNYWWTDLAGDVDEATSFGFAQRALLNTANQQPNSVGSQGATAPAEGGAPPGQTPEFLHGQTYGAAVDSRGYADCETGQRGYVHQLTIPPIHPGLATDPHTPGDQGTTWTGRARVPAGETYSRNPQFGPQLTPVPGNN